MTKLNTCLSALVLVTLAGSASATPINVSGSSTFDSRPAGILGDWTHTYSTGSPDVTIQKIEITLNSDLFFDLTSSAPGFLAWQNFSTINGGGTGFNSFSTVVDGDVSVVLTFNDFNSGESYSHYGDVDEKVNLPSCQGLGVIDFLSCSLTVTERTTDGSLVGGSEFAGSTIKVTLGGPLVANPVNLFGTFARTDRYVAVANWNGTVELGTGTGTNENVPEPSAWLLGACGLGALAARRWATRR